ncbi:MAG: hypothetical protein KAT65_27735, partial [Methanophagales archaeon]|nr:hypothetical protein [Methanophagales archaeon]
NIQPLSDDYIKFIRFAHWKLDRAGKGILGFITNNSYPSGVIHRGMRKELLETLDEIYILNLQGSSRTGERRRQKAVKMIMCLTEKIELLPLERRLFAFFAPLLLCISAHK